ncbi:MAG: spermidine synthase [Anaerovoracaceae bacterium]|jgi:spermidine synthase
MPDIKDNQSIEYQAGTPASEARAKRIVNRKGFLYLTEFLSGISVMAAELGASRLLSPYFSSSQIVWTIIIGTIMIAMALGNIYGGRSADKNPDTDVLYRRILIAGVWMALIPVLGKYVIAGISSVVILSVNSAYLIWAALASCFAIFVFPLFLLGTVTPSLIKYSVRSLEESGKTAGYLGAYNTIGSIIGTFLPTFVTIPAVGTSVTFLIFAGLLIALSLVYFIGNAGAGRAGAAVAACIFAVCCVFGHNDSFAFWNHNLTYEGESIYNYLQVSENDTETILSTNVLFGVQSIKRKDGRMTGMYYDYAMAAPLMTDSSESSSAEKDILILGNGSGTYASQCERYLDNVNIEGVEIDQKITDLAYKYFDMPDDVKVTEYDGRAYLQAVSRKYDVIMVDAYQDISVPFQMSTVEFFSEVKSHLKDGGVMVINMNMKGRGEGSINDYLSDTIASVFPNVYTVDVENGSNRELFASESSNMLENLESARGKIQVQEAGSADSSQRLEFYNMMGKVQDEIMAYDAGNHILTDDRAPVELLSMRALDGLIGDETGYYKEVLREEGISGLIQEL